VLHQPSCPSLLLEVTSECQLSAVGAGSRLSVVMTQMMRVAEWGTILVTCKTGSLKTQTPVQPRFNSVLGKNRIFSHIFKKGKLISAFLSGVLFLK